MSYLKNKTSTQLLFAMTYALSVCIAIGLLPNYMKALSNVRNRITNCVKFQTNHAMYSSICVRLCK